MTFEQAEQILILNLQGRYRGERSRLRRAVEILDGAEPGNEDAETIFGVFEIGCDLGGEG